MDWPNVSLSKIGWLPMSSKVPDCLQILTTCTLRAGDGSLFLEPEVFRKIYPPFPTVHKIGYYYRSYTSIVILNPYLDIKGLKSTNFSTSSYFSTLHRSLSKVCTSSAKSTYRYSRQIALYIRRANSWKQQIQDCTQPGRAGPIPQSNRLSFGESRGYTCVIHATQNTLLVKYDII